MTTSDLAKLEAAITKLATLLGDATTDGSVRQVMGTPADPAGTNTLRALKSQTNTNVTTASIKGLIDLMITLCQLVIDGDQATRRVARQVLREARITAGDFTTADVGQDI